jgi:hypothetical protein
MLWLAKELPAGKKIFRGSCAKKNIIRVSSRKKITNFLQKSAAAEKVHFVFVYKYPIL